MNKDLTHVAFVIDASGSMANLQKDTIGGFNRMVADQRALPGKVHVTLVTFNTEHRKVFQDLDVKHVRDLDETSYKPEGGTALLDAVGRTIDSLGKLFASQAENERPSKVMVVIITDGEENQSRKFTKQQIKAGVQHQQETYGWQFMFIGANVDAFAEAQDLGLSRGSAMGYNATKGGTEQVYRAASLAVSSLSSQGYQQGGLDVSKFTKGMDQVSPAKKT